MKTAHLFVFFIAFLCYNMTGSLKAQARNSVYSMFGIGQIIDDSYGINKSLGSTGIAFQSGRSINFMNPASYLGIAQNTIAMEAGLYGTSNISKNNSVSQVTNDINFSYFAANYYLAQEWALNLGIVPYSSINYEIHSFDDIHGDLITYEKTFEGSGGLKKIYLGNSFRIYKGLTIGFNSALIFGKISQQETGVSHDGSTDYTLLNTTIAYGFNLDYGLQYTLNYYNWDYTIGLIYSGSQQLITKSDYQFSYQGDVFSLDKDDHPDIKIPQKFGIGFAVNKDNYLRAGIDYEWRNWASVNFSNLNFEAKDSNKFSVGLEYSPLRNDYFYEQLFYRFGANYQASYLELEKSPINSYGINIGLGIPYRENDLFNVALEYGEQGTLDNGLIKNSYWGFYLNLSLSEALAISPENN